jgi:hypothetical protein
MPQPALDARRARRMGMLAQRETTSGTGRAEACAPGRITASGHLIDQELRASGHQELRADGHPVPDPGQDQAALDLRQRRLDLFRLSAS